MSEARSIHTKEAAKLLRAELKRQFPKTRFSVRTESYSMGSHIAVSWIDGPAQRMVEAVANAYSGSRFDGMSDSTYYVKSYLLPDGSAVSVPDQRAADGIVAEVSIPASAELVQFYGSAPSCNRIISPGYEATCAKAWNGLSPRERFALVTADRFPAWEGYTEGYKLAWFFDAALITRVGI
jgi:hypothetical protein